jgi:hypothetical protein
MRFPTIRNLPDGLYLLPSAGREARARHSTVTLFARFLALGLWLRPGLTALHIAGAM